LTPTLDDHRLLFGVLRNAPKSSLSHPVSLMSFSV